MTPRTEYLNLDGGGARPCDVYDLPPHPDYWPAVTDILCPVDGCRQTVVWYEAGYVPGYRVCLAPAKEPGSYIDRPRHRFLARGSAKAPTLARFADD